ncbi:MAG: MFS transporter [Lachnospiraceae bacterium]|nr:MFS transporter [Lachnospiraceae bacterium]
MKLNYKRTFFIGLAFLSISAFWQMYDNVIPLILQRSFHLNEAVTGAIMAADNVLAVVLLPLLGALSDKVDTPFGKRTPFIVGGTALAVFFMMLLPMADNSRNLPLFIISLGAVLVSMGLYRSPAVALMPDLTPKPLRSKANAVINLMGAIGGVCSLVMIKVLVGKGDTPDYTALFIGVAALMVLAVLVLIFVVREKKMLAIVAREYPEEYDEPVAETKAADKSARASVKTELPKEVKRSLVCILMSILFWFAAYNAVTTAFSRYATTVWGLEGGGYADCLLIATVAAIISYIPIGIIASKIGRKKTIMIGLVLMLACYVMASFMAVYSPIIILGFVLIGMGWAAISVNSLPMVVEMCSSADVGKYTGLYYTFSMSSQIVTPILSGILLQYVSYRTLFPYACFFTVAALITMSQVRHGDSKPEAKKSALENFDIED